PAVVSIEAKPKATARNMKLSADQPAPFNNFPGLPEELRKELDRFRRQPMPFPEFPGRAFGSGFVVDPTGIILTNNHVVQDADEVVVHFQDGRKFTSRDFKKDPKSDLAVVRIQAPEALPFLELGNSDEVAVGDRVLAVGAPLGMAGSVT